MEATTNLLNTGIDTNISAVQELSMEQLEDVNGGIVPFILAVAAVSFVAGYIAGADSCAC